MDRPYIIISSHDSILGKYFALYWGSFTDDNDNRSFGGYTSDIEKCEKYTLEEVQNSGYHFHIYEDGEVGNFNSIKKKYGDFAIRIEQMEQLGFKKITALARI